MTLQRFFETRNSHTIADIAEIDITRIVTFKGHIGVEDWSGLGQCASKRHAGTFTRFQESRLTDSSGKRRRSQSNSGACGGGGSFAGATGIGFCPVARHEGCQSPEDLDELLGRLPADGFAVCFS
jgi:hypothetical protein